MAEERHIREILHDIRNGLTMIAPLIFFSSGELTEQRIKRLADHSRIAKDGMNKVVAALTELEQKFKQ